MNKKLKNVLNIVLDVLIVLFLLFSTVVLVLSLSQKAEKPGSVSHIFGYSFRSVQSESMEAYNEDGSKAEGAFFKGDIIICKLADENTTYEVGDTVMFSMPITRNSDGSYTECEPSQATETIFVTHSISEIITAEDGTLLYETKGINEKSVADLNLKAASDFKAVYTGKRLAGFGTFIDFVQSGTGFFLCIILPIAIFVVIQAIRVIRNLIAYKAQKAAVAAASGELTEEQKRQIAEEYLKQQQAAEDDATSSTVDTADGE